jgi:hypothetical protein
MTKRGKLERLSLHPLTPEDALGALLQVKPTRPKKRKPAKSTKRRQKRAKPTKKRRK